MHANQHSFQLRFTEFFIAFIEYGSSILCEKHVLASLKTTDMYVLKTYLLLLDLMDVLVHLIEHILVYYIVQVGHFIIIKVLNWQLHHVIITQLLPIGNKFWEQPMVILERGMISILYCFMSSSKTFMKVN